MGIVCELRRYRHCHLSSFFGFLDFRSAERAAAGLNRLVTGNCTARDIADFVRSKAIGRVYLALPISTAPRIEELLKELRDTTASVYFVPNIFAFDLVQARYVEIKGMPAFSKLINGYMIRHKVRPGITGWDRSSACATKPRPSTRCSNESSTTSTT
jgi:hypothetical protein